MTITFSKRKITVLKNIMAILSFIIGVIYIIKVPTVVVEMNGHLDSVIYMTKYIMIGLTALSASIFLKYGLYIDVSR